MFDIVIFLRKLYMMIAEPRVYRIIQFGIYVVFIVAGIGINIWPPKSFEWVVGSWYLSVVGYILIFGGLFASVAVLPGIWWLERVGLILLTTGVLVYLFVAFVLGSSALSLCLSIAFILRFIQRWMEIRKWQLEPKIKKG